MIEHTDLVLSEQHEALPLQLSSLLVALREPYHLQVLVAYDQFASLSIEQLDSALD